jgi:hypothetical protein
VTQVEGKNLEASVRKRLANLAQAQKEDFQQLLSRYARERLLYRLRLLRTRRIFSVISQVEPGEILEIFPLTI